MTTTSPGAALSALAADELLAAFGLPVVTDGVPEDAGVLGLIDDEETSVESSGLVVPETITVLSVRRGALGDVPTEQRITVGGVAYRIRGRAPGRAGGAHDPLERWRVVPATSTRSDRGTR